MIDALSFLHAVENFIGRDLSREDGDAVIEMADNGYDDVQHVAELMMTRADYERVYGVRA